MLSTGNGDEGYTYLFSGEFKIQKNDPACEVLGALDELNSFLGRCRVGAKKLEKTLDTNLGEYYLSSAILSIQNDIFVIQAQIAGFNKELSGERMNELEGLIQKIQQQTPENTAFCVPGEEKESAYFDIARSVCRRVERELLSYYDKYPESKNIEQIKYLNRLSDFLYCVNRFLMFKLGKQENNPDY